MKQKIPKNAKIPFMKVIKKKWRLLVMLFPAMLFVFIFFLYSYGRNYIGI